MPSAHDCNCFFFHCSNQPLKQAFDIHLQHFLSFSPLALVIEKNKLKFYIFLGGAVSALAYSAHLSRRFSQVQKFSTVLHSGILLDVDKSEYSLREWFEFHEIPG